MSYYSSNQSYNSAYQQKDGNANGAIIGGLAGAGAMGATQAWGRQGLMAMKDKRQTKTNELIKEMKQNNGETTDDFNKRKGELGTERGSRYSGTIGKHDKYLGKSGNWKTRGAAYAGSALLGMGAGAGIDAMN